MSSNAKSQEFKLSKSKISVIEKLTTKYYEILDSDKDLRLASRKDLNILFSDEELLVINELYQIDPAAYGFKGEYIGIDEVPDDLVKIPSTTINAHGKNMETGVQYLPSKVMSSINLMFDAMQGDGAGSLIINSGYRSPAYQALLFLSNLRRNDYDLKKTLSRSALPGYSQHGSATSPAIDFITPEGIPFPKNPVGFEHTSQFRWLSRHANEFDFYLSYPEENNSGIIFEPWHWQYLQKS